MKITKNLIENLIKEELSNILKEQEIKGGEGAGLDDSVFRNAPMIRKDGKPSGKTFSQMLSGLLKQGKITQQQDKEISNAYMTMFRNAQKAALENGYSQNEAFDAAKKSAHDNAITAIKGAIATNAKASKSAPTDMQRQKKLAAQRAAQVGTQDQGGGVRTGQGTVSGPMPR